MSDTVGLTAGHVAATIAVAGLVAVSSAIGQEVQRVYPNARTGGNYMHAYYFPPAPSADAMGAVMGARWQIDRCGHERLDLEGRSHERRRP